MEQSNQIDGYPTESHDSGLSNWLRWAVVCLLVVAGIGFTAMGLKYRHDAFDRTMAIRYPGDVTHGFQWGQAANRTGLFGVYHLYANGKIFNFPNELDYAPLRMTVMYLWASWAQKNYPETPAWRNDFDFMRPVLTLNAAAEWVSSILVFLLIRLWIVRMDDAYRSPLKQPWPFRGVIRGMMGACIFWFNPAVVWDGTCFPQWDIWLAPFFLGAVLLCSLEWWFAAGCCIAIAAFLKAQILLVAPIFLIWPIFQLRWQEPVKLICGFAVTCAAIALPWLIPDWPAMRWLFCTILALGLTTPLALRWKLNGYWLAAIGVVALVLIWPRGSESTYKPWALLILLAAATVQFLPVRLAPSIYALLIAAAVFLIIPLYGASTAWYTYGFEFGTQKFMQMASHDTTYSLPRVLVMYYRWPDDAKTPVTWPLIGTVQIRSLMLGIYGACLLACGIGAAIQQRRNDTRFLAAMVAPWLCWFVLLTQLNNRYLVWAAGFSALLAGVGLGVTLLGLVVSFIGWMGIAVIMSMYGDDPELYRQLRPLTPHMAWPLLLAAAICLWTAIAPRRLQQRV